MTTQLREVLRKLTFAARTSGGTAGPDPYLMAACDEVEALLSKSEPTPKIIDWHAVTLELDRAHDESLDGRHGVTRKMLRNVCASIRSSLADIWQPIDTAPKDEFILVACPSGYTTTPWVFTTAIMHSNYKTGRWVDHANDDLTDWGMEPAFWLSLKEHREAVDAALGVALRAAKS